MAAPLRDVLIVKLGGSLALGTHLRSWLAAFAVQAGRVVVVPGGGPFADAVRGAQGSMQFDEKAAHRMALLAMEQFGVAMAALEPSLTPAQSFDDLRSALSAARTPIWMPSAEALRAHGELPASWDVTSDSLAAWLAGKLGAQRVAFIKHGAPFGEPPDVEALARRGVIDPLCPGYLQAAGSQAVFLAPDGYKQNFAAILAPGFGDRRALGLNKVE